MMKQRGPSRLLFNYFSKFLREIKNSLKNKVALIYVEFIFFYHIFLSER